MLIKCPDCGFDRDVKNVPPEATHATCPKCGFRFMFRAPPLEPEDTRPPGDRNSDAGRSDSLPGPDSPDKDNFDDFADVPEPDAPVNFPPPGQSRPEACPWESGAKSNFLWLFVATVRTILLRPAMFFLCMPKKGGYAWPFIFAVIAILIQAIFRLIWTNLSLEGEQAVTQGLNLSSMGIGSYVLVLFLVPLVALPLLLFQTALLHMALRIMQVPVREFETTFRLVCYSNAPMVLNVIPVVGHIVALIWQIACLAIGCRYVYQSNYIKIIAAVGLTVVAFITTLMCLLLVIFAHMGLSPA